MSITAVRGFSPPIANLTKQPVRFGNTDPTPTPSPAEEGQPQSKWKQRLKRYGPWAIAFFAVKGIITSTALGGLLWAAVTKIPGCSKKPDVQNVQPNNPGVQKP